MRINGLGISFPLLALLGSLAVQAPGQNRITTPKEQFGFNLGDDYQLANYAQLVEYWRKLDRESDRMSLVEIGTTAEGRSLVMAIITSPENHKRLDRYKETSRRLARAEGLSQDQARGLATEGKAVVWIDGGLHATEVLGAQQLMEMVYQMVALTDAETLRFLNDVILLAVCVNPDGLDLVADWYMRNPDPSRRSTADLPRLYQKYVGHDNNRDFYMSTQPETEAINRVLFLEWFPQIVYNHHQSGPPGTVLFAPPFRDPFNYYFDPLIPLGIDLVGAAMHSRFVAEGKPGATMRSGANYSTWWNGGLRTTVYFHNMIGLLTEMIGNPTPTQIPFIAQKQLPSGDLPYPIAPQQWHFRQSIEYSVTANRAVLDVASRHREDFLFNIYRMGRNAIEKGSRDHWTISPRRIAAVQAAFGKDQQPDSRETIGGTGELPMKGFEVLREPAFRDPRGYILPSDQPDFLTATKFINALQKTGITIHRATRPFQLAGKRYPAGSYLVKTAQAFRPHVLDMFEPQDHPHDLAYPGGPPRPPYDSAGWTLAYQMGVSFDRILEAFDGPFEKVAGLARPSPGRVAETGGAAGFLLSHQINDSFIAMNRLLRAGEEVYWLKRPPPVNRRSLPPGTVFVPAKASTLASVQKLAEETGLNFDACQARPSGPALKLRRPRIGLCDRYGGSMPSGWIRWILEKFEFPFEVVYPPQLDQGDLASRYDVLIFADGLISEREAGREDLPDPASIPAEYRERLGHLTVAKTIPQLRSFLEQGGTVLAIGGSTVLGYQLGLPIMSALSEKGANGTERPLPSEKFYVPGSVLQVRVDPTSPLAYGLSETVDVFFDKSPVFRLRPEAALSGLRPVAWFDSKKPLRSGWAWGEAYLEQGTAVVDASVGKGKLLLFGPEITFRAQPHGTFKFLFNGIYYGRADLVNLP